MSGNCSLSWQQAPTGMQDGASLPAYAMHARGSDESGRMPRTTQAGRQRTMRSREKQALHVHPCMHALPKAACMYTCLHMGCQTLPLRNVHTLPGMATQKRIPFLSWMHGSIWHGPTGLAHTLNRPPCQSHSLLRITACAAVRRQPAILFFPKKMSHSCWPSWTVLGD